MASRFMLAAVALTVGSLAHAAEALVALGDKEAVPDMVALLDAPEASIKTVAKDKPPALRQLVRVNHLMNCKTCHPAVGTKLEIAQQQVRRIPICLLRGDSRSSLHARCNSPGRTSPQV